MGIVEAVERLKSESSVAYAFVMDADTVKAAFDEEASVVTTSGMPLDNMALKACTSRSVHLCIFCTEAFEVPTEHVMVMMDANDRIVGFDVPRGREGEFKSREDLVWLSDDFAMDPNAFGGEVRMVMLPQDVATIGDSQGVSSPVLLYPSTSVDMMLKAKYGIDPDSLLASGIISFNPTD